MFHAYLTQSTELWQQYLSNLIDWTFHKTFTGIYTGFREFGQKCIKLLPETLTRSEVVSDACGEDQLLDVNEGISTLSLSFLIETELNF